MEESTYDQFLDSIPSSPFPPLVRVYHAVRNLPYGSIGHRDPLEVAVNRRGSCSGKHLLLRNLLRRTGYQAEIITMFTHFESRLSPQAAFPDELNDLLRQGEIPDFHHYVRARQDGDSRWHALDATWHDALIAYTFPVNSTWGGTGDTILASTPIYELPAVEDLIPDKARRVASLSIAQQERRSRFFQLVSQWISTTLG